MDLLNAIKNAGQAHILRYLDELDMSCKAAFLEQVSAIEWDAIPGLVERHVLGHAGSSSTDSVAPAEYLPLHGDYRDARQLGETALREGQVAAFTVAGGQGTRLGFDAPKGFYPISPVKGKPLFQLFAEALLRTGEIFGRPIPWYVMTSRLNDEDTKAFFAERDHFGIDPGNIVFLSQGEMPAFDMDGKLILASRGELAMSPDGHGGSLKALALSGALADMASRGVRYISYFQVDNPLVHVVDPVFLGLHVRERSQVSSRMIPKREAKEKMGVFCEVGGHLQIIEYSDLPEELAELTDGDGELLYRAGSPAIHIFDRDFVETLTGDGCSLPFHRAFKKVPFLNDSGQLVKPKKPNAVKLEMFVFDAIPMADRTMLLEAERATEFAPVKNAEGADSPETCRMAMQEMYARWLANRGVDLPRSEDGSLDCRIEISPRAYVSEDDFRNAPLPTTITPGQELYLS